MDDGESDGAEYGSGHNAPNDVAGMVNTHNDATNRNDGSDCPPNDADWPRGKRGEKNGGKCGRRGMTTRET